ncbi:MAG: endonuclease III domain-containing protein, partial [Rhabdochlamydiaceae bacterium]
TQAERVERYYRNFIKTFPNFAMLAEASFGQLYSVWRGLGYNRRALFLKKTAEKVIQEYGGKLPHDPETLEMLPGIGRYTARAIACFSWNEPVAFVETNIRRAYLHHFFPKRRAVTDKQILKIAEQALDTVNPREWHWALMDYGAYLKTITENPNRRHKNYAVQSKFEGSPRQIRGMVLRMLSGKDMNTAELIKGTRKPAETIKTIVNKLELEGFLRYNQKQKTYQLQ